MHVWTDFKVSQTTILKTSVSGRCGSLIAHKVVTLVNLWCTHCCFQFHSNIVYSETTLVTSSVAISPLGGTSFTQTVQLYLHWDSQALCMSSHLEDSWHENPQNAQCETKSVCSCVDELGHCLTSLQNAPHTMNLITSSEWNLPYSREKAAFPAVSKSNKYT